MSCKFNPTSCPVYNGSSLSFVNAPANRPAAKGNPTLEFIKPLKRPPSLCAVPSATGLPSASVAGF